MEAELLRRQQRLRRLSRKKFSPVDYPRRAGLPGWLAAFANNQPLTQVVDAVRGLVTPGAPAGDPLISLAWSLGLVAVAAPLAIRAYRRL